uniref:Uncharacterized protein n=1 Tax=Nelumbo nucifera TaxID=4432 RepID=A0A822ZJQ0_NELNU|nr:TPA_asm: hypothetical protein HUJ06_003317 [Nelumbo nucifera]
MLEISCRVMCFCHGHTSGLLAEGKKAVTKKRSKERRGFQILRSSINSDYWHLPSILGVLLYGGGHMGLCLVSLEHVGHMKGLGPNSLVALVNLSLNVLWAKFQAN